jgi:hypothetical protein
MMAATVTECEMEHLALPHPVQVRQDTLASAADHPRKVRPLDRFSDAFEALHLELAPWKLTGPSAIRPFNTCYDSGEPLDPDRRGMGKRAARSLEIRRYLWSYHPPPQQVIS